MSTEITVIGAVLDTHQLTLYDSTGKSHDIPQTAPNFEKLVDELIPVIQVGGEYKLNLEASSEIGDTENYFQFQQKNTLGIRFKRVAKSLLSTLFGTKETPAPGVYGEVQQTKPENITNVQAEIEKQRNAAREIISNAPAMTAKTKIKEDQETTLVATLGNAVIPGADKLKSYLAHSRKINDYSGLENLILRLSQMIGERKHSILDVVEFLERGDLPITDRGDVLGYKRLYAQGEDFVDPHTRTVTQRPGDFVCMDVNHVDTNRRTECSYGLHVGRRDYMGSFSGDSLFLVMIAPEDIITVPHNDPNKVRVCGYHLLEKLPDHSAKLVYQKDAFASHPDGAHILKKAISNEYPPVQRIVKISDGRATGSKLQIEPAPDDFIGQTVHTLPESITGTKTVKEGRLISNVEAPQEPEKAQPVAPAKALSRVQNALKKATKVKEKARARKEKELSKPASRTPKTQAPSRNQKVAQMVATMKAAEGRDRIVAAQAIIGFKKKSKVSWEKLGVGPVVLKTIETTAAAGETYSDVPDTHSTHLERTQKTGTFTQVHETFAIYDNMSNDPASRLEAAKKVLEIKRRSKRSWASLGIRDIDADLLTRFATTPPVEPKQTKKAKPKSTKPAPEKIDLSKAPSVMEETQKRINEGKGLTPRQLFEAKNWVALHAIKKAKKKSWKALGFSSREEDQIIKNTPGAAK